MTLIEDARQAWRFASVRLAIVAGFISGWAATDPDGWRQLMDFVPEPLRPLVGFLVAFSAIYSRIIKQGGKANG